MTSMTLCPLSTPHRLDKHTEHTQGEDELLTPLQEALHVFLSGQSGRAELLINSHQQVQQRLQADGAFGVILRAPVRLLQTSGPCGPGARGHGGAPEEIRLIRSPAP